MEIHTHIHTSLISTLEVKQLSGFQCPNQELCCKGSKGHSWARNHVTTFWFNSVLLNLGEILEAVQRDLSCRKQIKEISTIGTKDEWLSMGGNEM